MPFPERARINARLCAIRYRLGMQGSTFDPTTPRSHEPGRHSAVLATCLLILALAATAFAQPLARFGQQGPQPAQTSMAPLAPGTELTYYMAFASHPGPQAGQEARGLAGDGYMVVTIHDWTAEGCVATSTLYSRHIMDRTLGVPTTFTVMGQGGGCDEFWSSAEALQATAAATDPNTTIGRGQHSAAGQTFQALSITREPQQQGGLRTGHVYDEATGIMLSRSEGTGDRSWVTMPTMASSNSNWELVNMRVLAQPWRTNDPLPDYMQNITSLHYQGSQTMSLPGVTMFDTSVQSALDVFYQTERQGASWMVMNAQTTLAVPGSPAQSETRPALISPGRLFIPPAALATLRPGQVLDEHPVTGVRTTVESDPSGYIVVTDSASGFVSRGYFAPDSGLLLGTVIEEQNQDVRIVTVLELIDVR